MSSSEEQVAEVLQKIGDYVQRKMAPLEARIAEGDRALAETKAQLEILKDRAPEKGDRGEGADMPALLEAIERASKSAAELAVAALPKPKDGASPDVDEVIAAVDSKMADRIEAIREEVKAAAAEAAATLGTKVDEAIEAMPEPEPGKDADPDKLLESAKAIFVELLGSRFDDLERSLAESLLEVRAEKKAALTDIAEKAASLTDQVEEAIAAIPEVEHGDKGDPGRDAADLEILPTIDEAKSYARGKFATYRGGLWRAFETTAAMRGWECIVDGLAELQVNQSEDSRTFIVRSVLSSGKETAVSFAVPVNIYRKIWQAKKYALGDSCTYDGSLWIAIGEPDEADEPGSSKMWQMAVRKGRDGRNGMNVRVDGPLKLSA